MRVHVVDPSAFTPPYDHALARALGEAGAEVELFTSRFSYGPVPVPRAYTRHEFFYRLAHRRPRARARSPVELALKLGEHVPDMLRYRRAATRADVVHFQWLTVQPLDVHLLPRARRRGGGGERRPPLVLTAHDVLPREPRPGQLAAQRRLYERVDAVVVHSVRGRRRLTDTLGVDPRRVHVIPHGVLIPGEDDRASEPSGVRMSGLPDDLAHVEIPVALFFGLLRPYKGLDVLLEAWHGIEGAELWVVGMPRMDIESLRAAAPAGVRFVSRFVPDGEAAALLDRADLVVLPYREIDQSGVALTALGAGAPLVLTDVGGFPELAATGAARLVAPDDPAGLHRVLRELLEDEAARRAMSGHARAAAAGPYAWEAIAQRTLELYRALIES
jgi:glycosyltransferase involved in cell wall biosynthesis